MKSRVWQQEVQLQMEPSPTLKFKYIPPIINISSITKQEIEIGNYLIEKSDFINYYCECPLPAIAEAISSTESAVPSQ